MLFLFEEYSWITSIGYFLLDLLPAFLRKCVLKLVLGSFGKGGMIDRKVYFRYPGKIYIGKKMCDKQRVQFLRISPFERFERFVFKKTIRVQNPIIPKKIVFLQKKKQLKNYVFFT